MTVLQNIQGEGNTLTVKLDKGYKPSFGICIVRGEVKDTPSSKMTGIFIKDIVPQSPAALCGKLRIGDRILSLNDNDVRNATEQNVIDLIRAAGQCINLQIQTFDISDQKGQFGQPGQSGQTGQTGQTGQNFQTSQSDMKSQNQTNNNSSSNKSVVENGFMSNGAQNQETNKNQENYSGSPEGSDDDDDDTRDMTGRMYTEAGYEIDRASAGNVKRSKNEIAADTEQEDEYGYTQKKIKKRYGKMGNVHKTEVIRPANAELGLALAGHRDRQKMACMVAGVNPSGIAASGNLKAGDEILEVNGNVLLDRCHLNASVVFKNLMSEKIVFVVLRRTKGFEMAVKPVQRFPAQIDETEYLFTAYKNVRKVQVQKAGSSLGIMIIEGKHVEVGAGIFISDLQEDSNAMKAGLQVGEMILAINKDVIVDSNYDSAADLLKKSQGLVTLIVANLKSEEQIAAEAKKAEEAAKKAEEKKNAPPPEPEKPQDPSTAEIKTNQKTLIEIKLEKKPLGVVVSGGKNSAVTTGVLICHIFENGKVFEDKRLQVFDQIIELNGNPLNAAEMSVLKIHQAFHLEYEKVTMMVWRNDPSEVETVKVDINRKSGKDLGLSMAANPKGACVTNIGYSGCPDVEKNIQIGDIINKLNGTSLEGATFPEIFALFRQATGKINMEILRAKPTTRT